MIRRAADRAQREEEQICECGHGPEWHVPWGEGDCNYIPVDCSCAAFASRPPTEGET